MNSREKYEYWLDIAEYDIETARSNYNSGRYLYVVFMCQQSIEKLIKGIYVLYTGKEADRTHNIARIFNKIFDEKENRQLINDDEFDNKKEKYMDLFAELLYYYIAERYPSYKEKLSASISKDKAKSVLDRAEEVFVWIKILNQYKN